MKVSLYMLAIIGLLAAGTIGLFIVKSTLAISVAKITVFISLVFAYFQRFSLNMKMENYLSYTILNILAIFSLMFIIFV